MDRSSVCYLSDDLIAIKALMEERNAIARAALNRKKEPTAEELLEEVLNGKF